ncbi:MAG TPA: protein kinase [Thermoanaerobaculia bacterium]|nr:protein kinase [Thermoanaerobaculia bacterium]
MSSVTIGKYRLLDQIGAGAMGEVFRAHDSVLDRPVALKIIIGGDEEKRQRFRREAQSAARLTHPNIVVVHDFGEDSGRFFMAMELLDGVDLKRAIAHNHIPDLRSRLTVMEQIADALAFAHAMNIVHRDLKPANIFLLPNGQVKILDFGLARVGHSSMTGTGTVLGTPNYMSPEQIKGLKVDPRCDIFSLGTVFYELLSSRRAFEGESLHSVLYKVLQHEPEALHAIVPGIPRGVSDLVARAMAKDPALRFQRATDLRDAIRLARDGGMSTQAGVPLTSMSATYVPISDKPLRSADATMIAESVIAEAAVVPITFTGEIGGDIVIEAPLGKTILDVSLENGIPHAHACGGNARCSTCRVAVSAGLQNLSPRNAEETKLARRLGFTDDVRLACQTRIGGAVRMRRLIRDDEDVSIVRSDSGNRTISTTGSEMPLAILHASVREGGTLTRGHLAHDVVHILNRYYMQVGDAILANGGSIGRYDGTTIVAFFGLESGDAKTKCTNAVRAALRMQKRMGVFDQYLSEHFGLTLTLDVGLHYGRMIVGQLGHPEHAKLTAIGEAANVAAAVAALNESHGAHVLATEELVNVVEAELRLGHVSHDTIRQREFSIYEIVDFAKPDVHDLVQTSFELVYARKQEAATIFYGKLFEIAPDVRPLFSKTDMRAQGDMLMNMLGAAVRGLDRLDELKPALEDLGRRHIAYGVQIPHYAMVEACLLYTVETIAGPAFNLDVKLAWTAIYNFIAQTMIEATA